MPLACFAGTIYLHTGNMPRHVPTLWRYCLGRFDAISYQEIILSSGVFRRETASGFYPWGNVDSPRKRVAERLCGRRHGNSFPMTQSAQSHRQMRSIPLCPKAVFLCFLFLIPLTIRQQCIIIAPSIYPLNPDFFGGEMGAKKIPDITIGDCLTN